METKENDLPKSIVVILVVLAVAISLLGTFTVLNEMSRLNAAPEFGGTPTQTAKIQFAVEKPPITQATGKVTFNIIKSEV